MMGESKSAVLAKVPKEIVPKTILIKLPVEPAMVLKTMEEHQLILPVIFKPDLGERGWMVAKIESENDVEVYLKKIRTDFIIQEYVSLPLEFGVSYYRFPDAATGVVNSITAKEFLSVVGDGRSTVGQLIHDKPRARIQEKTLYHRFRSEWNSILPYGQRKELVPIGNHARGTKFINASHLINPRLIASFDSISRQIDGFYFGRFDLRCATLKDLEIGNIKVVELNGCGAEPAHIYDPGYSFWKAMADLFTHVRLMYQISVANHKRGVPYLSFAEGRAIYRKFRALRSGS
jgi:hypothetical protein